jgi:Tfp pilus assembly protein PilE
MTKGFTRISQSGFSLLDLMTVVALVSLLSSIAFPRYRGYVARARMTEAKIMLSALYVAETGYWMENDSFSACLGVVGFSPATPNRYYRVGFSSTAASSQKCGRFQNAPCNIQGWISSTGGEVCGAPPGGERYSFPATASMDGILPGDGDLAASTIAADSFQAVAAGPAIELASSGWLIPAAYAASCSSASKFDAVTLDQDRRFGVVPAGTCEPSTPLKKDPPGNNNKTDSQDKGGGSGKGKRP